MGFLPQVQQFNDTAVHPIIILVDQFTFPDEQKECWIEFSEDCPVSDINITIQDVYRGTSTTWNDTCIAGIEFYGAAN